MIRRFQSTENRQPTAMAIELEGALQKPYYSFDEQHKAAVAVDMENLLRFTHDFYSELYVVALIQGNVGKAGWFVLISLSFAW